jgi:hypothetical protein
VEEGDLLCFETWGGGGWGDPLKRDAALVAADVDRGLVTIEGALRYGVVLRDDLSVDREATAVLREELAGKRGPSSFSTSEEPSRNSRRDAGRRPGSTRRWRRCLPHGSRRDWRKLFRRERLFYIFGLACRMAAHAQGGRGAFRLTEVRHDLLGEKLERLG